MKKLIVIALVLSIALTLAACNKNSAQSDDNDGVVIESPLIGTWRQIEYGVHGNAQYFWSFAENGHFAYLFSAYEPPHGGGDIQSSVRECFMQGKFRIDGSTIECYDLRYDDYFSWGDKWKYFRDRDAELIAGSLLSTPVRNSKSIDDFTLDFDLSSAMILQLVIDRGSFPDQYDMQFELVGDR